MLPVSLPFPSMSAVATVTAIGLLPGVLQPASFHATDQDLEHLVPAGMVFVEPDADSIIGDARYDAIDFERSRQFRRAQGQLNRLADRPGMTVFDKYPLHADVFGKTGEKSSPYGIIDHHTACLAIGSATVLHNRFHHMPSPGYVSRGSPKGCRLPYGLAKTVHKQPDFYFSLNINGL
jgi:hypothetical protein